MAQNMIIKEALNLHAATLEKLWAHDRTQTIGASDIGQCARKTYWTKNEKDTKHNAPRDNDYHDGWGAKLRGTLMENEFWAPAMIAKYGDKLLFAGKAQRTFISSFLSATPDGLLTEQPRDVLKDLGVPDIDGDCLMVECKTIDPRANLHEAKPENVFQTQVQMGLVRELTPWKPNYSLLSYTDASFWDEVTEFVIPFDPKIFEVAKQRARQIMTATSFEQLKPEGWIAGGSECEYCPFTRACGIARKYVPDQNVIADAPFVAQITDMAKAIRAFEDAIESNNTRMRDMQNDLRERLRGKGVRKIPNVVTWTSVKGRKTYDASGMKAALIEFGIDVEQFSKVGDPSDRLVITLKDTAPTS